MDITLEQAASDFEQRLDDLTQILQPAPLANDPPPPAGVDERFRRINRKRVRLALHLHQYPHAAIENAPAVFETMVYDIDASFIRLFVDPMIEAVGRRAVQEAILHRLETGSPTAQIGASMAWYHSQATADLRRRPRRQTHAREQGRIRCCRRPPRPPPAHLPRPVRPQK